MPAAPAYSCSRRASLAGSGLSFRLEPDPHRFRQLVDPFLGADPVARTLPITVLDAVISGLYEEWVLAAVESGDGVVTGCAVQTPPHNVIVAAIDSAAAHALADGLRAGAHSFPGVVGLTPVVHDFAAAWCEGSGVVAVDDRAERLFRLDAVVPPRLAPGRPRLATPDDVDLLVPWTEAFGREVGVVGPRDVRHGLDVRIGAGRAWLWEIDGEGGFVQVVSYVGNSPVLLGQARIGPVYTPPELRGAGYASNVVAHVSELLLGQGVVPTLFTDLANPTSNAIYRALGYTPVADAFEVRFVTPP